jgi:hypothetical protein
MMLKCVCPEGRAIAGYVEFVFPDGTSFGKELEGGVVDVPVRGNTYPRLAVVKPMDGHWNTIVMHPSSAASCRCETITYVDAMPWWKSIVGASRENGGGKGVRIGVVDLGFQPWPSLRHVTFMNPEGEALDSEYYWRSFWDPDEGIRTLRLLGCQHYPTSDEEDELRHFTKAHWEFFYTTPAADTPRRPLVQILWPKVEEYRRIWHEQRETDYWAAGKAMAADLSAAQLEAPKWPRPADYPV